MPSLRRAGSLLALALLTASCGGAPTEPSAPVAGTAANVAADRAPRSEPEGAPNRAEDGAPTSSLLAEPAGCFLLAEHDGAPAAVARDATLEIVRPDVELAHATEQVRWQAPIDGDRPMTLTATIEARDERGAWSGSASYRCGSRMIALVETARDGVTARFSPPLPVVAASAFEFDVRGHVTLTHPDHETRCRYHFAGSSRPDEDGETLGVVGATSQRHASQLEVSCDDASLGESTETWETRSTWITGPGTLLWTRRAQTRQAQGEVRQFEEIADRTRIEPVVSR